MHCLSKNAGVSALQLAPFIIFVCYCDRVCRVLVGFSGGSRIYRRGVQDNSARKAGAKILGATPTFGKPRPPKRVVLVTCNINSSTK